MVRQSHDAIEFDDLFHRALHWFARVFVDDAEHLAEQPAMRFGFEPSRDLLRYGVHQLDSALGVAGNYAVTDRGEGCAQILFGAEEFFCALLLCVE